MYLVVVKLASQSFAQIAIIDFEVVGHNTRVVREMETYTITHTDKCSVKVAQSSSYVLVYTNKKLY